MAHLTIVDLERFLGEVSEKLAKGDTSQEYVYVETGKYKPFHVSTVKAAQKRGYRIKAFCGGTVFYVYPKELSGPAAELAELTAQWEAGLTYVTGFVSKGATIKVMKEDSPVKGLLYTVLRYFQINGKWMVSCDAQRVLADDAIIAIAKAL